jgi:hypothetical protein
MTATITMCVDVPDNITDEDEALDWVHGEYAMDGDYAVTLDTEDDE